MNRQKDRPVSQRQLRVGESIRHSLSNIFMRVDLRDPLVNARSITITEVRCTPDLRNANIYIFPFRNSTEESSIESQEIIDALQRSAAFLRGQLNSAVKLKYSPKLNFLLDTSFDSARNIQKVLDSDLVARDLRVDQKNES